MIALTKPVRRRLELPRNGRLTVELGPEGIRYREYRSRRWLLLPHSKAYLEAAKLEAARLREERTRHRQQRRST